VVLLVSGMYWTSALEAALAIDRDSAKKGGKPESIRSARAPVEALEAFETECTRQLMEARPFCFCSIWFNFSLFVLLIVVCAPTLLSRPASLNSLVTVSVGEALHRSIVRIVDSKPSHNEEDLQQLNGFKALLLKTYLPLSCRWNCWPQPSA
jgi:hypothetical protein